MGFERYVDYALDVPMYFVKRGDSYIDVSGKSFRDHLRRQARLPGERATHLGLGQPCLDDFSRGAAQALSRNARRRWRAVAAAAVAAGVLGRAALRRRRPRRLLGDREGLDRRGAPEAARRRAEARLQGRRSAAATCSISRRRRWRCAEQGLERRKQLDRNGRDETRYLRPLEEIVARGITPAEELLEKFHGAVERLGRADIRRVCVLEASRHETRPLRFRALFHTALIV